MKYLSIIIFTLISINAAAEEKIGNKVQFASENDKIMNDVMSRAKSTLDNFFSIHKNPPKGAEDFKLKVMVSDGSGVEHFWFTPFKEVEGGFAGVLQNEPTTIKSMEYGNVYAFKRSQITDWGYVLNSKQIGSFTVCALFESMDKETVLTYKNDYGFVCDS